MSGAPVPPAGQVPPTPPALGPGAARRPGRPRRWRTVAAWALATAALSLGVVAIWALAGHLELQVRVSLYLLGAQVAVLVLAVAAVVAWARRRAAAREERIRQEVERRARSRHQKFLSRLDHELKNPLTAIRAAVAELTRGAPPAAAAHLDVADSQAQRMSRLVTDLRKLSELGAAPIEWEDVDLAETVTDAVEAAVETASARGWCTNVHLDLPRAPWPLPHVRGDADLLFTALLNVVSNATKYTPPTGTVEVRGWERAGAVTLEVSDTGIGVPEADLPGIFSELARATNARGMPGSGLGLALVDTIVTRHAGSLTMHSREGVGSRLQLTIPVGGA